MIETEKLLRLWDVRKRAENVMGFAGGLMELEPEADRRFLLEIIDEQIERLNYIQEWADVVIADSPNMVYGQDVDTLLNTPLEALRMEEENQ